jgi:hypothetical protein
MRSIVYDILQVISCGITSTGAGMQWGLPAGLMVLGVMLLALSIFDAVMASQRTQQPG